MSRLHLNSPRKRAALEREIDELDEHTPWRCLVCAAVILTAEQVARRPDPFPSPFCSRRCKRRGAS